MKLHPNFKKRGIKITFQDDDFEKSLWNGRKEKLVVNEGGHKKGKCLKRKRRRRRKKIKPKMIHEKFSKGENILFGEKDNLNALQSQ